MGFQVSLYSAVLYPTGGLLKKNTKTLQLQIDQLIYARQFPSIDELIVFYQPFINSAAFQREGHRWVQTLKQQGGPLRLSVVGAFSAEQPQVLDGLAYYSTSTKRTPPTDSLFRGLFSSIQSVEAFSNEGFSQEFESVKAHSNARLVIHSDLVMQILGSETDIPNILSQFNNDAQFLLNQEPPPQKADSETRNWISVSLLILWLSFALHYVSEPTYRRSISRFLFNHPFFASDIFNRHQRMVGSSVILLLQNVVLSGLVCSLLIDTFLSDTSFSMIKIHWPALGIFLDWYFGGFLLGVCLQSILSLLQLVWLRYIHPETTYFSQIMPLLAWPTHLSFIIVPIILVIIITSGSALFARLLVSGYVLLKLLDFVAASHGISLSATPNSRTHLRTTFPYILLFVLAYVIFGWYFGAHETWRFAFYLTDIS